MAGSPVLPRNVSDPLGADTKERRAMADFKSRMRVIHREVLRVLDSVPYQVVTINAKSVNPYWPILQRLADEEYQCRLESLRESTGDNGVAYELATNTRISVNRHFAANATVYRFDLDENVLARMNEEIALIINTMLLEGGERSLWFMDAYVRPAYQQGSAQSHANLTVQSAEYALSRPTLESVLLSEPYRRRIGLVRAREFEQMRGLTEWMRGDLGATLARGMANGQNPRTIARDIRDRIGASQSRAERIARTEITAALKNARLDEDADARDRLGIRMLQMQLSAFSPTTRPTHAARNARLFSEQEVREWRSRDGNDINCRCAFTAVLVDDKNNPLTPEIIERAKKRGR